MQSIFEKFMVTNEEYLRLNDKFGALCEYASWQLIKKNSRNNHTDDQQDIAQELRSALLTAGAYYKRQIYIEQCLKLSEENVKDGFIAQLVMVLKDLWKNKTRHGANRQKFGFPQEKILEQIVRNVVPKSDRPCRKAPLKIDCKFTTYCKAIIWNKQKAMGKKISREKGIRAGQVSISEYDYLVSA